MYSALLPLRSNDLFQYIKSGLRAAVLLHVKHVVAFAAQQIAFIFITP